MSDTTTQMKEGGTHYLKGSNCPGPEAAERLSQGRVVFRWEEYLKKKDKQYVYFPTELHTVHLCRQRVFLEGIQHARGTLVAEESSTGPPLWKNSLDGGGGAG